MRTLVALATATFLLAGPFGSVAMAAADQADGVEISPRDVYVIVGSTLRNPTATTSPKATLFNVAGSRLESSPSDPITWGEWSAAKARSAAKTVGVQVRKTDVQMTLRNLVPGGLYSVFWITLQPDSEQPLCPGVERSLPLDAVTPAPGAPAPNAFYAPPSGPIAFHGKVKADLLAAGQVFFSIVSHWSGETHYPFPNKGEFVTQGPNCHSSFGDDAMRHLTILQKL